MATQLSSGYEALPDELTMPLMKAYKIDPETEIFFINQENKLLPSNSSKVVQAAATLIVAILQYCIFARPPFDECN